MPAHITDIKGGAPAAGGKTILKADTMEELNDAARELGLNPAWLNINDRSYELRGDKRDTAIRKGIRLTNPPTKAR